jgi:hypothetical protein
MAHTLTRISRNAMGERTLVAYRLDITTYVAGGVAIAARDIGLARIDSVQLTASEPVQNADHVVHWDRANGKVYAIVASTGAEAGAVDLGQHELWAAGLA